jgi:hypothetical protein
VSAVSKRPASAEIEKFEFDWQAIAAAWKPPAVLFARNVTYFEWGPPRLARNTGLALGMYSSVSSACR